MSGSDITIYNVLDEGELEQIPITGEIKNLLTGEMVVLLVIDSERVIYLWKGANAKVRRKFIAARVSQDLRGQKGLNYRVESIDHGDEPPEFIRVTGGPIPKESASEPTPPIEAAPAPKAASKAAPAPKAASKAAPAPKASAAPRAAPQISAKPKQSSTPSIISAAEPSETTMESTGGVQLQIPGNIEPGVKAIINEIEKHPPPAPYQRELVIIGPYAFSISETRKSAFGQEQIEHRWEMASPPEGQFLAQGYTPRTIIQSGKVLAVELLKGGPGEVSSATSGTQIQVFKIKYQK